MRAHDVGIGSAIAGARLRGEEVSSSARISVPFDATFLLVADRIRMQQVTRGPVVEPVPYADASVAFGLAMAKCHNGYLPPCLRRTRVYVSTNVSHVVDLDPRRWPGAHLRLQEVAQ